jgi:NADH-quinone oxidoreductase subunit A
VDDRGRSKNALLHREGNLGAMGSNLPTTSAGSPWATIAALFFGALIFAALPLLLAWLWARFISPAKPGSEKNASYECGLEAKGDPWIQFKVSYYLYAIVFLIFDVEVVFLLPFAAAFTRLSAGACAAMLVFLLLLVEGLVWACQKGVLTWTG